MYGGEAGSADREMPPGDSGNGCLSRRDSGHRLVLSGEACTGVDWGLGGLLTALCTQDR